MKEWLHLLHEYDDVARQKRQAPHSPVGYSHQSRSWFLSSMVLYDYKVGSQRYLKNQKIRMEQTFSKPICETGIRRVPKSFRHINYVQDCSFPYF